METFSLPRNPDKMKGVVTVTDKMVANKDVWIIIPSRYKAIGMLSFNIKIQLVGVFYITDGKSYSVSRIAGTFEFNPDTITEFVYEDISYTKLYFEKGTVMTDTSKVIMLKDSMFGMLQEFILRGKPPIFLTTMDILHIFNKGAKYVDKKFKPTAGKSMEAILAAVSRVKDNPHLYSRSEYGDRATVIKGLMDMEFGYNNAPSKITHNYFKYGLASLLKGENKTYTKQDKILKGE